MKSFFHRISHTIIEFQARIILAAVYVLAAPFSIAGLLRRKKLQQGGWQAWTLPSDTIDDVSEQ